jgi:thiamine pyrophosphate-dependent acetolactate synthase large subunit-like protein
MLVHQAIAAEIVALGVRDAFTFTAEDVVDLVAELTLRGVHVHHTRHEHTAIGMADGYARVSGRAGLAIVGAGVGLTNAINSLLTASKANTNLVVLTGEVPGVNSPAARLQRKHVDQRALLTALGVKHVELESPASMAADIRAAFELAERTGQTIVVNLPDDILRLPAGDAPTQLPTGESGSGEPRPEDVARIVERIGGGERIVILAGRGAVRAGAGPALDALAEASGALLATSLMARGLFHGSPWDVGVLGGFATPAALELVAQADLVLAFGASLNYDTTGDGELFPRAAVVHVDQEPAAIGRFGTVDVEVIGDAGRVAAAILAGLPTRPRDGRYRSEARAALAEGSDWPEFEDSSGDDGVDPRTLMTTLDRALPDERTVVVDGGSQKRYPVRYLRVPDETGFVWPTEYGAIGCGLGAALGAAVARPERLTVLCIGDGALMMSLSDLDTAARYDLRLLVVVSNNFGLGAEYHHLVSRGYDGDEMRYANHPFAEIGASLGFATQTIRTLADLEAVAQTLGDITGPTLLDCHVPIRRVEPGWKVIAREKARRASVG